MKILVASGFLILWKNSLCIVFGFDTAFQRNFSRFILCERWKRKCNFENLVYIDQLCIHETPNISLQRKNSILFVLKN
jgi:hypothetical protein